MNDFLAKTNPHIDLTTHSKWVSEIAEYLIDISYSGGKRTKRELKEIIKTASLLHDLGKINTNFQKKIKGEKHDDNKFRHNEIAWAFLTKHLSHKHNNLILNLVYWHHGISNPMNKHYRSDILKTLKNNEDKDVKNMFHFLEKNVNKKYISEKPNSEKNELTPTFYVEDDYMNHKLTYLRSCLISADRITSLLEVSDDLNNYKNHIDGFIKKENIFNFIESPYDDKERFKEQQKIVKKCDYTTLVKAPAGFGKTLVGLLWSAESDKKLIWVCPRNAVAESVYFSIEHELKNANLNDVKIELYLTGETKKANYDLETDDNFNSDIIITNIDNYLRPVVSQSGGSSRMFLINNADVVFDEFHELIDNSALFAAFHNIFKSRHVFTNGRTLLLSATPNVLCELDDFNSEDKKIKILPDKNSHYNAAHNKKYFLNIIKEKFKINTKHNLIIHNTIKDVQKYYKDNDGECFIMHSGYLDNIKTEKINYVLENYGKTSNVEDEKDICGAPIVQAGLDISLNNLYESVLSPESTLQRIGRCNRWGGYTNKSQINIFKKSGQSERMIKKILYDYVLSDKWFDYLKNQNKELTLNEIYDTYNSFNKEYNLQIKDYMLKKLQESKKRLCGIYPFKLNDKKRNNDVINANGNKLRQTTKGIFFIVKEFGTNKWVGPFSDNIYENIGYNFNEETYGNNISKMIKKVYNELKDDKRFDYDQILKKHKKDITLEKMREYGEKSNTPYVRFDMVYHNEYGLIDKNFFNSKK